ncbi:MAG TPA: bifunctional 4-hydroxy-2-oxoglutarate aldolase/2-dehydro-3-deoxy-phosphogluconate aldolase [Solirubrobacteraceae bacterium]|nr:bifunctional 4-hydroxy-2-oxoglutarate aldolase/2-dehydro-3-deoxy-phosphogluconate aldolase [Solirubrobacteraceae bacterium]
MLFRETESALDRAVVVPVVREESADEARSVAAWLIEQGLEIVELTASTPGWERAVGSLEDVIVGVGTLRTREDAQRAVAAGARFLVTPCPAPGVRAVADAANVPLLEGGFTPGEILAAADRGIAKLFPAHVGGTALLRSILALSPGARIVPTGGIGLADVPAWLDAGAYAVGIGSELRPDPDVAAALRDTLAAARAR